MDDSLLTASTIADLKTNLQLTIDSFERAGFLLNYKKSQMQPTQQMEFLGFLIDTAAYTISLTQDKWTGILRCVNTVLDNPSKPITIRFLATIIGKIVATFPCSHDAPLHYRVLDSFKVKSLRLKNDKWSAKILLSTSCLQELGGNNTSTPIQ